MADTYDPVVVVIGERHRAASMPDDPTGRRNMRLLIQLRWIALIGQVATIVFVHWVMGVALPQAEIGTQQVQARFARVAPGMRSAKDIQVAAWMNRWTCWRWTRVRSALPGPGRPRAGRPRAD